MTRVAVVHDWLTGMRGGERVLEALLKLLPSAEIFTLIHTPGSVSPEIERRPIHTSFLQHMPGITSHYRSYLPLFPTAIERFDLSGFDLVVSVSHAVAKGVRPPPGVPHLCYCLTPMRYVWDLYDDYFGPGRANPLVRAAMPVVAGRLRVWDKRTANRVDRFVAISNHVQERIRRIYDRPADVVYPPVQVERFGARAPRGDFHLVVSALVASKRIDIAIQAFNQLGRCLVIVGQGPELPRLRRIAGPTITFAGWVDDATVAEYYAKCRALIIPGEEDFGITAVEAQAAGAPVVAYGRGGVRESVISVNGADPDCASPTGVLYARPTVDALVAALERAQATTFDPAVLRANAAVFAPERFAREMRAQLDQVGAR
jgi:glycosyltransferase involved in cell wall biosynthesis